MITSLADYRWLVGRDAHLWLNRIHADPNRPLHQWATLLRRECSASRAHLVLEQVELRRRGGAKFPWADRLFFTDKGYQQATDWTIASYKAQRFPSGTPVLDACCGIGGDLLALSERGPVIGVDRDPIAACLASANGLAIQSRDVTVRCQTLVTTHLNDVAYWHCDPDRRPSAARTIQPDLMEPTADDLTALRSTAPNVGIKLAPATEANANWLQDAELEWIGHQRSCQQLVAWFGDLAKHHHCRVATVLREGSPAQSLIGHPLTPPLTTQVMRFVVEPHAAVLAAGLAGSLAADLQFESLTGGGGYLTADTPVVTPFAATFEVLEVMPLHMRRVRRQLAQLGIGAVEVKKRGADVDPARLAKALQSDRDGSGVVIVTRFAQSMTAIIARRWQSPDS